MENIKQAVVYLRVSTETQVEKGQGLEVQKKLCHDYCRKEGIAIQHEFVDKGVSGATIERDGNQDMLASLNGADYVVVANTSRLWRDDFTRVLIQRELKKAGKDIKSVDNPSYSLYADSPESYLMNGMMELLDSYERLTIALKLKRARKLKASKGQKATGTAPFGYRWVEIKQDGRKEKVVVVENEEAEIVRNIFKQFLRHKSASKVRNNLKQDGITNRRGKEFSRQALYLPSFHALQDKSIPVYLDKRKTYGKEQETRFYLKKMLIQAVVSNILVAPDGEVEIDIHLNVGRLAQAICFFNKAYKLNSGVD